MRAHRNRPADMDRGAVRAPSDRRLHPVLTLMAASLLAGTGRCAASPAISPAELIRNLQRDICAGQIVDLDFPGNDLHQIFDEFERISGLRFELDP